MSEAASRRDWPTYFRLMREGEDVGGELEVPRPPAEHSSRDPWPDGFAVPPVVAELRTLAESLGWEVRIGYSRAYLKQGRGYVRASGRAASWVAHHLVQVGVRRPGGVGRADAWIIYRQDVGAGKGWTFRDAVAGGQPANVTEWRTFINAGVGAYAGGQRDQRGGKND